MAHVDVPTFVEIATNIPYFCYLLWKCEGLWELFVCWRWLCKKEFELFDWRRPVGWIRILNGLLLQLQKSTGVVTFVQLSELFLASRLVHPQLCLVRTLKLLVICPPKTPILKILLASGTFFCVLFRLVFDTISHKELGGSAVRFADTSWWSY